MAKRALDILVAIGLLLATLPVIVMAAVITAVVLQCSPFFSQERIGRDGKPFRFIKLRTLPPSAPKYADKYSISDIEPPRFCAMMRRLHLDELPQLFLVLKGDMSLVGPRPEMAYLHEQLPSDFAGRRTSVRPGCTGLWQVSAHADRMIHENPDLDEFYLDNRTLRLDLWTLWQTFRIVVPFGWQPIRSGLDVPRWLLEQPRHQRDCLVSETNNRPSPASAAADVVGH